MRYILVILMLCSCRETKLVQPWNCEPQPEICNNYDDDCDGETDEGLVSSCEDTCGVGFSTCINGGYSSCNVRQPEQEVCNAIDDDCDGAADNNLPVEPCYPPGDWQQVAYGICRIGINRCVNGTYACIGWVGPQPELCNGLDDNCDGTTDEGNEGPIDVVIAMDYSGSMATLLEPLVNSIAQWTSTYSNPEVRYALLGIPSPVNITDGSVSVMGNISTPADFSYRIRLYTQASGGGSEGQLDAIWLVSDPLNPLGINWTPGASRAILVFTDEEPQSYLGIPDAVVARSAQDASVYVYIFTSSPWWFSSTWTVRPLVTAPYLYRELDTAISQAACR